MPPRVTAVIDAPKVSGRHTGVAPRIRKMKIDYPELSEAQIAKRVGCDPANVHRVLTRFLGNNSQSELANYQESKADIYDALQLRSLASITDDDLVNASVRDRAVAAGIWEDKARVIRGQATQINVSVLLDAVAAIRDMRKAE